MRHLKTRCGNKCAHTLLTVVALAVAFAAHLHAAPPSDPSTLIQQIVEGENSATVMAARRNLLQGATNAQLREYLAHRNDTIALVAGWERLERAFDGQRISHVDATEVGRFVGLVEGRLHCTAPDWWQEQLRSAVRDEQGNIFYGVEWERPGNAVNPHGAFTNVVKFALEEDEDEEVQAEIRTRAHVKLALRKEGLEIQAGKYQTTLPRNRLKKLLGLGDVRCDVTFDDQRCYFVFGDSGGFPFEVSCLELKTRNVAWTADVWSVGRQRLIGYSPFDVELSVVNGQLMVFGSESSGAFLEVFDAKTGKNKVRCSSYYFEEIHGSD